MFRAATTKLRQNPRKTVLFASTVAFALATDKGPDKVASPSTYLNPTSSRFWPFPAATTPKPTEAEDSPLHSTDNSPSTSKIPQHLHHLSTMPTLAPGRPENLTPAEEKKLQEFWSLTLKSFGVLDGPVAWSLPPPPPIYNHSEALAAAAAANKSNNGTNGTTHGATNGDSPKKKTSRFGFLSRGGGSKDEEEEQKRKREEEEKKSLEEKERIASLPPQTPEELRFQFWSMVKCDDPDALLLRFLRARKWDAEKALEMMMKTMSWRGRVMDVATVVKEGEGVPFRRGAEDAGFMHQLIAGKSYLHGTDIDGRPVCWVTAGLHFAKDQTERDIQRFTIYTMETARLMLRSPVDTACVVFDMSDFSINNMDYAPVRFMIDCFEAHYPESLGVCCIHKAPWVFQGIWNIVKAWLDPVVASKIHFTTSTKDLTRFIPSHQIPKNIGGTEDWTYSYSPKPPAEIPDGVKDHEDRYTVNTAENIASLAKLEAERRQQVERYEELTREWIKGAAEKKEQRTKVAKELEKGYWGLDKYIRGRGIYDRTGVIGANGEINFYPNKK
ncbi:CRAL-TRIO domain-containing protein [Pyronema domesticum]|nr:CRAL-TRIO domain-containing protein [Pyronema domesticum]